MPRAIALAFACGSSSLAASLCRRSNLASRRIAFRIAANLFLYRLDDVGIFFPESLEVELPDELASRHLPWFLVVVVQFAELFGIHSQFAGHLDLGMG